MFEDTVQPDIFLQALQVSLNLYSDYIRTTNVPREGCAIFQKWPVQ